MCMCIHCAVDGFDVLLVDHRVANKELMIPVQTAITR